MLFIDDRIGSRDLIDPLRKYGVPADLHRLEYGDFAFVGRGSRGFPLTVGIELKNTSDLLKSLSSGRFTGHQLPGLLAGYDRVWLLTEGIWRASESGVLEVLQGGAWRPAAAGTSRIMARDLDKQLLTLTIRGGVLHHHCATRTDTVRWLSALYHWWVDKDLDEHKSHLAFHQVDLDRALLEIPSLTRKVAKELPGVGWEKSRAVESHFGSVHRMVTADRSEWTQVPGIGKTLAARITTALREGERHE